MFTKVDHLHAPLHSISRLHGHSTYSVFTKVLLNFSNDVNLGASAIFFVRLDPERVVNCRQVPTLKLNINNRSNDLDHFAGFLFHRHYIRHVS